MRACNKPKTKKGNCSSPAPILLQNELGFMILKTILFSGVILPGGKTNWFWYRYWGPGTQKDKYNTSFWRIGFLWVNWLIKGLLMKLVTISRIGIYLEKGRIWEDSFGKRNYKDFDWDTILILWIEMLNIYHSGSKISHTTHFFG